jgi:hypothetical protein
MDLGNLAPHAQLHGPDRILYGDFQHVGGDYCVVHYLRRCQLKLTMKKYSPVGFVTQISCGSSQIASVRQNDDRSRFQIDVQPGIDSSLVVTTFLAACAAEQSLIDAIGTTV